MSIFLGKIREMINIKNKHAYALAALVLIGIFFRAYNFHDWLYFYPDQARDVTIVDDYVEGRSPLPLLGFKAASTNFQLGAMYSYFQIISAEIFGSTPSTDAYPDLFFGVLSIPLLYLYLKRYFSANISLAMMGLYSISFYAIRYSRFAWNINPIPFFILLFLSSLHEILFSRARAGWWWVVLLGVAMGVGVQLHTVLLVSLPAVAIIAFAYTMMHDWRVWGKWAAVFLIALILNCGQIISETRTGFLNTKSFFTVLDERSPGERTGLAENLVENVICQSQSNILFLSSLENNDNCNDSMYFRYDKAAKADPFGYASRIVNNLFGLGILSIGCYLLIRNARRETDEKRVIFLHMNLIYSALIFIALLPIITHNGQVRYWLPVIFLPFLFLGLAMKYCVETGSKKYYWICGIALTLLVGTNLYSIMSEAHRFAGKARSNAQYVVLGELESISTYIREHSQPQGEAYITGGQKYIQNFYRPLAYVASKDNFTIKRVFNNVGEVPAGKPLFFIAQSPDITQNSKFYSSPANFGLGVEIHKSFGNIGIYKIDNPEYEPVLR